MLRPIYQSVCTAPQIEFLNLKCKYPALVAGYGSGKTHTLIESADRDAWIGGGDAWITIYAPTYGHHHKIILPRILERLNDKGIRYKQDRKFNEIVTDRDDYGNFRFVSLDNPGSIIGYEDFRAHVDELDTLKADVAEDVWIKIQGRNRQVPSNPKYDLIAIENESEDPDDEIEYELSNGEPLNRISAYTTPEGYRFVYRMWDEQQEELGHLFQMVRAATMSNPFLPPGYISTLKQTYPSAKLEAYLNGIFTNLDTGTVYRYYDPKKHASKEVIRGAEDVHIGMDFNIDNMAAVVAVRRGDTWHIVEELRKDKDGVQIGDTKEMIDEITRRYSSKGHKVYIYPDLKSGYARKDGAPQTSIQMLKLAGFQVRGHGKSNPAVEDRVNVTNRTFELDYIKVNPKACPEAVKCLIRQAYDEKTGQPCKKTGFDHMNDALGYLIYYWRPIKARVYKIDAKFRN